MKEIKIIHKVFLFERKNSQKLKLNEREKERKCVNLGGFSANILN